MLRLLMSVVRAQQSTRTGFCTVPGWLHPGQMPSTRELSRTDYLILYTHASTRPYTSHLHMHNILTLTPQHTCYLHMCSCNMYTTSRAQ